MSDLTTHDVLCATKAYLMQHGWRKGEYGGGGGPACLVGALAEALRADPSFIRDEDPAYAALNRCVDLPWPAVESFNDHPGRTFDEVIAALDQAILATAPTPVESPVEPKVAA